jgi:hypothetical protein
VFRYPSSGLPAPPAGLLYLVFLCLDKSSGLLKHAKLWSSQVLPSLELLEQWLHGGRLRPMHRPNQRLSLAVLCGGLLAALPSSEEVDRMTRLVTGAEAQQRRSEAARKVCDCRFLWFGKRA